LHSFRVLALIPKLRESRYSAAVPEDIGITAPHRNTYRSTARRRLADTIRSRLRHIQRQPDLITAFLGQTGLTLQSEPP